MFGGFYARGEVVRLVGQLHHCLFNSLAGLVRVAHQAVDHARNRGRRNAVVLCDVAVGGNGFLLCSWGFRKKAYLNSFATWLSQHRRGTGEGRYSLIAAIVA